MWHLLPLVCGLALASVDGDLERASQSADDLLQTAQELDRDVQPGRAYLNQADAQRQFEDSLFALMIDDHRRAAEGFFALVTTNALEDPELRRDAEWYLAESMFGMGNVVTAEASFREVAQSPDHPFREDAVRMLLELYASTGRDQPFMELYEREFVQGRLAASGLVTYTIAKSFYRRGDLDRAAQYFGDVVRGDEWYTRSRYFLGVIAVRKGELTKAADRFLEVAGEPASTVVARRTSDLALLALARLAYEQSDFQAAAEYYGQIAPNSEYLADVLREQVWSFIKQERYDEALKSIDLFLIAFPEHQYTGELRVVQGHLFMGCGQMPSRCPEPQFTEQDGDAYERALTAYEVIVDDYTPIRDRFAQFAVSQEDPAVFFGRILDPSAGIDAGLPGYAVAMMTADPTLGRALELYGNLDQQRADLLESELLIAELQAILSGPTALGGFDASRYRAISNQARAIRQQVELLNLEKQWLAEQQIGGLERFDAEMANVRAMTSDTETQLQRVRAERIGRDDDVGGVRAELVQLEEATAEAEAELRSLRRKLEAPNRLDAAARADVEREAADIEVMLRDTRSRIGAMRVELSRMSVPEIEVGAAAGPRPDEELLGAIGSIRDQYRQLRPARDAEIAARFDQAHAKLEQAQALYGTILDRLEALAEGEVGRILARFKDEVANVDQQRIDMERVAVDTERLALAVTRDGFGRMRDFFADSVVKAEMGIIDVYWARKMEIADQRERIQTERNQLVAELERRFAVIRQKMEQ